MQKRNELLVEIRIQMKTQWQENLSMLTKIVVAMTGGVQ